MKLLKTLTPFLLFGMAVCVAAGAAFVSLEAAALQDEAENVDVAVAADEPVDATELPPPDVGSPVTSVVPMIDDEKLAPEEVAHSRQHNVVLNMSGEFHGRLSQLSGDGIATASAGVKMRVVRHGMVLTSTVTDEEGVFSFSGLSEGVVALIATGDDALLMFSVRLVQRDSDGADPDALPVDFHSIVVSGTDLPIAREILKSGLPETDRRFGEAPTPKERTYKFGTGESATSLSHHQIQLDADGNISGEINILDSRTGRHREIVDLTLHVIHDGVVVSETEVAADGSFTVSGLSPGAHSLVATGLDGTLAAGFDVVDAAIAGIDQGGRYKLASVAQTLSLSLSPVNSENLNQQNADRVTDGELGTGAPGASPGGAPGGTTTAGTGGGGGGGGGTGGGGGLGALVAGAAGAAIAAAADDDSATSSR